MAAFVGCVAFSRSTTAFLAPSFSRSTRSLVGRAASASVDSDAAAAAAAEPAKKKAKKVSRVLSGVQPTGSLHLGNYLGAIRQWVDFQNNGDDDTESFFCVVDLHAVTAPHDPDALREDTLASAALYLAAGIDPAKGSKVFVQSHVPAHSELAWLLNCATPINWLERMIQYKDKAAKAGSENVGVGLFTYPVLMAADILLYQADRVPVGEDQRQHLELARDVVRRFNDRYCKGNKYKKRCKSQGIPSRPAFTEPEAMIVKEGARVMSLTDGASKMSKSDPNDASRINVLDPPDVIRSKIKKCKTDALVGLTWDDPDRPESTNLLNVYSAVQPVPRTREDILAEVGHLSWGDFKPLLADAVIAHLTPIQERYREVRENEDELDRVLAEGAAAAEAIADRTLTSAKVAMGFAVRPSTRA